MNCFECASEPVSAVAICHLCGKGLCREHAVRQALAVFETVPGGMAAQVRPTGKRLPRMLCSECADAVGTSDAGGRVEIGHHT